MSLQMDFQRCKEEVIAITHTLSLPHSHELNINITQQRYYKQFYIPTSVLEIDFKKKSKAEGFKKGWWGRKKNTYNMRMVGMKRHKHTWGWGWGMGVGDRGSSCW